jgi:hypothetical protein
MTVRNVRRRLEMGLTHGWLTPSARAALPATAGWRRRRLIELVHTVELAPCVPTRRSDATLVVQIYKDLERARSYFPIVLSRSPFELNRSAGQGRTTRQLDVIDPSFAPEKFVRTSWESVLAAVRADVSRRFESATAP